MTRKREVLELLVSAQSGLISRRELMQRAAALGLSAGVLAAWQAGVDAAPAGGTRPSLARGQASGGEVIVGSSQETVNYNPLTYANNGPDTGPEVLMFDSLMKVMPDGSLTPNLASEVPTVENGGISADGLTWT